ncbi:hypothetical protein [Salmonirosea aquatica]|uniref:Uncharacterized protein n=1 Tax=Salmonirosea aquatica TaxID=2654236 RepID=A0A7C9FB98_9BACT|nr:hypothetical protein [Cytophagaceae bacterium SJW1-29]
MSNTQSARPAGLGTLPIAYGQLVDNLLQQQNPHAWQNDLWAIFTGFMVNQANEGNNPKLSDLFATFRDLHSFFEELKAIQARKEGTNQ